MLVKIVCIQFEFEYDTINHTSNTQILLSTKIRKRFVHKLCSSVNKGKSPFTLKALPQ